MRLLLMVVCSLWALLSNERIEAGGAEYKHYKGQSGSLEFYYTLVRSEHMEGTTVGHFFSVAHAGRERQLTFVLYPPLACSFVVEDQHGNVMGKGTCVSAGHATKKCTYDFDDMRLVVVTAADGIPTISGMLREDSKTVSWKNIKLIADGVEKYGV